MKKELNGINLTCYTNTRVIDLTHCKIVETKHNEAFITAEDIKVGIGGAGTIKLSKKQFDEVMKNIMSTLGQMGELKEVKEG